MVMHLLHFLISDHHPQVSGQKFYYLRNAAALLELALVNWAITKVVARGFTPIMTPDLVKESVLEKCGFQPRGTNTQVDNDIRPNIMSCNFGYVKITPSPHTFV